MERYGNRLAAHLDGNAGAAVFLIRGNGAGVVELKRGVGFAKYQVDTIRDKIGTDFGGLNRFRAGYNPTSGVGVFLGRLILQHRLHIIGDSIGPLWVVLGCHQKQHAGKFFRVHIVNGL